MCSAPEGPQEDRGPAPPAHEWQTRGNGLVFKLKPYQEALDYLYARTTGETRLGLERTDALLDAMGNPHDGLAAFHIAGTNGKGSVAAILEALLRARGLKVGKYTSPHLIDFRERIQIDGKVVSEDLVTGYVARWTPLVEKIGATFFEATTAMAFDAFAREEVDVAVIETGLGGRLDSTNVITPRAAVITSVAIDHTEYLGETIEEIAREKAGIFKRGIPAVVGERDRAMQSFLAERAMENGSQPICLVADAIRTTNESVDQNGTHFSIDSRLLKCDVHVGLRGAHQVWNTCSAIATLQSAGHQYFPEAEHVRVALPQLILPGRFHSAGKVVFDVAHNPDGTTALVRSLRAVYPDERFVVLLCVLSDKDWRRMLAALAPVASHFVLTNAPTAPAGRRWDLKVVAQEAAEIGASFQAIPDFDDALDKARLHSERLLITGSFHTVGDAMTRLQVSPLPR